MKHNLPFLFLLLISLQTACAQHDIARPWDQVVIYFALTDRFFDGDASNNRPPESDPALYDPTPSDMDLYHGGDFRGLEIALENGYFNALGITAIWITPPLRNVWYAAFDSNDAPKTGYHGYWTQDFLDIDPHLTSARSLDGSSEYPDTRDGRPILPIFKLKNLSQSDRNLILSDGYSKNVDGEVFGFYRDNLIAASSMLAKPSD